MGGRSKITGILALIRVVGLTATLATPGLAALGVEQSESRENPAVADLKRAADRGDIDAAFNLGVLYDTGRGVPQDLGRAAALYRKAAERGHVRAAYNLALLYAEGLGVRKDEVQAAAWYKKAAELGDPLSQYNLAVMFENGRGVARDYTAAMDWYSRAADNGHAGAMYNLGAMYYRGQGVLPDVIEAHKWRHLAVLFSSADTRQNYVDSLDAFARFMTPEQIGEAERRAGGWSTAFEARRTADHASTAMTPEPKGGRAGRQILKAAVEVVEIEATVVDSAGHQVRDLSAGDFSISVDGHDRRAPSVTYVSNALEPGRSRSSDPTAAPQASRRIVIAIDENNIPAGRGRSAARAAQRLLDKLNRSDGVAVCLLPNIGKVAFTSDRVQLDRALERVAGRASRFPSTFSVGISELLAFGPGASAMDREAQQRVISRECPRGGPTCEQEVQTEAQQRLQELEQRARGTLDSLALLFAALGPIPGPKTVVLISGGLATRSDPAGERVVNSISTAAGAARVRLHSILLDGDFVDADSARPSPSAALDSSIQEQSLRDLTRRAGGTIVRAGGLADSAFDRVAEELSGYYLLAIAVQPEDRDGRPHRILVTTRSGLAVRARTQFVVPRS
ncbi:MAG TPA: VWA domain-containing protein [Vicinamibacterales bacterium]|jgi:VWFA-related protein|nr:VWA domain-containing protein [Vicinamibacterales bacterium]